MDSLSSPLLNAETKIINKFIIADLVVLANAKCHSGVIIDLGLVAMAVFGDLDVNAAMLPIVLGVEGHLLRDTGPAHEMFTVANEHAEITHALDVLEEANVLMVDVWRHYERLLFTHLHRRVVLTIVTYTMLLNLDLVCDMLAGQGHLVMSLNLMLITHQVMEAMLIDVHLAPLRRFRMLLVKVSFGDDLATGLSQGTMLQLGYAHIQMKASGSGLLGLAHDLLGVLSYLFDLFNFLSLAELCDLADLPHLFHFMLVDCMLDFVSLRLFMTIEGVRLEELDFQLVKHDVLLGKANARVGARGEDRIVPGGFV